MAKKNTGKELEKLVGRIYELLTSHDRHLSVQVDVNIESPDGPRQFDVVLRSDVDGIEALTVIEVRDWKKRLSISHVDGFASKREDVDAQGAILVSRYGFQSSAIRKARRKGIDICTAHHLENLKDFRAKVPVVVHYLKFGHISINCTMPPSLKSSKIDFMKFYAGEEPALAMFRRMIASGELRPKIRNEFLVTEKEYMNSMEVGSPVLNFGTLDGPSNQWTPENDSRLTYRPSVCGEPYVVGSFEIDYSMMYEHYYGHLTDLPGTFALDNISTSEASIFYDPEAINDFEKLFRKFSDTDEVPSVPVVNMHFLEHINYELLAGLSKRPS